MGVATLGRAASAVIAGLMWVAAFPVEGQAPFVYSVIYNGAYLVPEMVICMAVAGLVGNRLLKTMNPRIK
jgi:thiamine transporter